MDTIRFHFIHSSFLSLLPSSHTCIILACKSLFIMHDAYTNSHQVLFWKKSNFHHILLFLYVINIAFKIIILPLFVDKRSCFCPKVNSRSVHQYLEQIQICYNTVIRIVYRSKKKKKKKENEKKTEEQCERQSTDRCVPDCGRNR